MFIKKIGYRNYNFVITLNEVQILAVPLKSNIILTDDSLIIESLTTERKLKLEYSNVYTIRIPKGKDRFKPAKFDERRLVHTLKENKIKVKGEHFIQEYMSFKALTEGQYVPYLHPDYSLNFGTSVFELNKVEIEGKNGNIYDKDLVINVDSNCFVSVQLPSIKSFKIK